MGKVNVPRNDLQWIAQAFDLALAGISRKQVKLQGTSGLGHGGHRWDVDSRFEGWGFLEVPYGKGTPVWSSSIFSHRERLSLSQARKTLGQIWDNDGTNLLSIGMNDDSKQKAQVIDSLGLFM